MSLRRDTGHQRELSQLGFAERARRDAGIDHVAVRIELRQVAGDQRAAGSELRAEVGVEPHLHGGIAAGCASAALPAVAAMLLNPVAMGVTRSATPISVFGPEALLTFEVALSAVLSQ